MCAAVRERALRCGECRQTHLVRPRSVTEAKVVIDVTHLQTLQTPRAWSSRGTSQKLQTLQTLQTLRTWSGRGTPRGFESSVSSSSVTAD